MHFCWVNSIGEIAASDWDQCFSKKHFARGYAYQKAIEDSSPRNVRFQYLLAFEDNTLLAIIGCFGYRIPLSISATGPTRRFMNFIERFLPNLFTINGFFIGQLTSVCDHLYGLEKIPIDKRSDFFARCEPSILERAQKMRSSLIIHKEIPQKDLENLVPVLSDNYIIVSSLPSMELFVSNDKPYELQLRKKYRNRYRRRQRSATEHGLNWSVHRGPISEDLAKEMEHLYLQVLGRSATQFERLSSPFFASVLESCPGASVVLCKDKNKLVGFIINIEAQSTFHGLYLGYNSNYRSAAIYPNLIYRSIDIAQERGYEEIHLGQTSYETKSALGAKRSELYLALRARNPLIHAVLKLFRAHLFPATNVPSRRVFPANCSQTNLESRFTSKC